LLEPIRRDGRQILQGDRDLAPRAQGALELKGLSVERFRLRQLAPAARHIPRSASGKASRFAHGARLGQALRPPLHGFTQVALVVGDPAQRGEGAHGADQVVGLAVTAETELEQAHRAGVVALFLFRYYPTHNAIVTLLCQLSSMRAMTV
jgi:hypothetical protein